MTDHLDQIANDLRALNEAATSVGEALQTVEAARDGFQANAAAQLVSAEYLKTAGASLESASASLSAATEALARFEPERIERELTALRERVVAEATRTREEAERHAHEAKDGREAMRTEAAATRRQLLIFGIVFVLLQVAVLVAVLWS